MARLVQKRGYQGHAVAAYTEETGLTTALKSPKNVPEATRPEIYA